MADRHVTFYHYTSDRGRQSILNDGVIRQSCSRTGDAVFGKGVYGTSMDPYTFSKSQLARNNYDGYRGVWETLLNVGRVDYAFKVKLPESRVEQISHESRDIMVHKGHIDLERYNYTVHPVPNYQPSYHQYYYHSEHSDSEEELGCGPPGECPSGRQTSDSHLHHDGNAVSEADSGFWNQSADYQGYSWEKSGRCPNCYCEDDRGDDDETDGLDHDRFLEIAGDNYTELCGRYFHSGDDVVTSSDEDDNDEEGNLETSDNENAEYDQHHDAGSCYSEDGCTGDDCEDERGGEDDHDGYENDGEYGYEEVYECDEDGDVYDVEGADYVGDVYDVEGADYVGDVYDVEGADYVGDVYDVEGADYVGDVYDVEGADYVGDVYDVEGAGDECDNYDDGGDYGYSDCDSCDDEE